VVAFRVTESPEQIVSDPLAVMTPVGGPVRVMEILFDGVLPQAFVTTQV
jgi:hypothetical protein